MMGLGRVEGRYTYDEHRSLQPTGVLLFFNSVCDAVVEAAMVADVNLMLFGCRSEERGSRRVRFVKGGSTTSYIMLAHQFSTTCRDRCHHLDHFFKLRFLALYSSDRAGAMASIIPSVLFADDLI